MDPVEKKRLANERRLKAIQEQKQRNQQNGMIKPLKINVELTAKSKKTNNLKLFDSDGEEDNNDDDTFKIRPQFEGENGLQMLEMSSEFSSRFKLDERFIDDDKHSETPDAEGNEEKAKNIKILESILGYEVSEKYPVGGNASNKRQIDRFDPEDERASKYVKKQDASEESAIKPRKKKKDKSMDESKEVPISKERYIEVAPNLKDLFSSSSSFSLTSKFQTNGDQGDNDTLSDLSTPFQKTNPPAAKEQYTNNRAYESRRNKHEAPQRKRNAFETQSTYTFFITGDDSRLKEGVKFFMRPKSLEEIQKDWNQNKETVMEQFRTKKKSYARKFVNKHRTTQGKRSFIKK